jgi:DNA-binding NtrC family response regulator
VHSDFRLVSATHKPLKEMAADGTFREDLYYRISGFPIRLPALRERAEDLPLLCESLLQRMAGKQSPKVTDEALERLSLHSFPGNIRELRNILERARLFADDGLIRPEHLPEGLHPVVDHKALRGRGKHEMPQLAHALETFRGSRSELAAHLGMSSVRFIGASKPWDFEAFHVEHSLSRSCADIVLISSAENDCPQCSGLWSAY